MQYRKLSADQIFDGYRFLHQHVLILSSSGEVVDLVPEGEGGEGVEKLQGILAPGLVNCHCHLELSHMKGLIPEKTGLVDFVFSIVSQRHFSEEEILAAIGRGEEEMIRNGIVAVGDISNNALSFAQKSRGNLAYYTFIEASGWLPQVAPSRLERMKSVLQQWNEIVGAKQGPGNLFSAASIVPHAPYSVSGELWSAIAPDFEDKVVSIHNQEAAFEDPFFIDGSGDFNRMYEMMGIDNGHHSPSGRSSLQSYFHQLSGARSVLLVHNTFTQKEDVAYVQQQVAERDLDTYKYGQLVSFCLCPNANLYIEDRLPDVEMLRQMKAHIVLGTDSLASNHSLSIWDEILTLRKYYPSLPLEELLQWATLNGAQALGIDDVYGSFEKGKCPGVVLIGERGCANMLIRIR